MPSLIQPASPLTSEQVFVKFSVLDLSTVMTPTCKLRSEPNGQLVPGCKGISQLWQRKSQVWETPQFWTNQDG